MEWNTHQGDQELSSTCQLKAIGDTEHRDSKFFEPWMLSSDAHEHEYRQWSKIPDSSPEFFIEEPSTLKRNGFHHPPKRGEGHAQGNKGHGEIHGIGMDKISSQAPESFVQKVETQQSIKDFVGKACAVLDEFGGSTESQQEHVERCPQTDPGINGEEWQALEGTKPKECRDKCQC
jgi:hypothetical protein